MKNFKNIWVKKAQEKNITSSDMVAYSILRALAAKSEHKSGIAKHFVDRAFTPGLPGSGRRRYPTEAKDEAVKSLRNQMSWLKKILGVEFSEIFDNMEEFDQFKALLEEVK